MAMFDCAQVCLPSPSDVHVSSDFSSKTIPHPPFLDSAKARPAPTDRASLSFSEPASTAFGSDNDKVFSSGDEDSLEFQSDTAHDSVASRAVMSTNPGQSGVDIQNLFKAPTSPPAIKPRTSFDFPTSPPDFTNATADLSETSEQPQIGSTPTNNRAAKQDRRAYATPAALNTSPQSTQEITSSPPTSPNDRFPPFQSARPFQLSAQQSFPFNELRSFEQHTIVPAEPSQPKTHPQSPKPPQRPFDRPADPTHDKEPHFHLSSKPNLSESAEDRRLSIFEWSEQPSSERESFYGSSPRPRTVHSKQVNEARVGRPVACRAPNALHLRSQSVPVAKDSVVDSTLTHLPAKFGTWGLGNKGVSEEWTDDFDFGEIEPHEASSSLDEVAAAMQVPQAIIDRQASVHGQFGLVQEFMLLVEELKRLRHQGSTLNLLQGDDRSLWEDAENIINLATLNDEDEIIGDEILDRSPRFSGTFDDFDDGFSPICSPPQAAHISTEDDTTLPPTMALHPMPTTPPVSRTRGESLAQAKSFLQTMHQNRRVREQSAGPEPNIQPPKLPFDTQDLQDLVNRTSLVKRSLKDLVRRAEGVVVSPNRQSQVHADPPLCQIFDRPGNTSSGIARRLSFMSQTASIGTNESKMSSRGLNDSSTQSGPVDKS